MIIIVLVRLKIIKYQSFPTRAIGSWWVDRCRCSRADPDASNTATTPATNEAGRVSNGDCNGKINNGVNKDVVVVNNENNHDNGNAADTERLELLSSSKQGNCVSVVDGNAGTKSGSMV